MRVDEAYVEVAEERSRIVRVLDGFIDEKFYLSPDGERVTIVRFRDAASQREWARYPEHLVAQRRGLDEFYAWYDISVSNETYSRSFSSDAAPG
jgi:heme-degrading monooxygenase HmoA